MKFCNKSLKMNFIQILSGLVLHFVAVAGVNEDVGGEKSEMCGPPSWTYFLAGEKCFKLLDLDTSQTYTRASGLCVQEDIPSALPSIDSPSEEEFLVNLIQRLLANIHHHLTDIIMPVDKTFVNSTWGISTLCLHMKVERENTQNRRSIIREWDYLPNCRQVNSVVCQKPASWAPSKILSVFLEHRQGSRDTFQNTESKLTSIKSEVTELSDKSKTELNSLWAQLNSTRNEMTQMYIRMRELMGQMVLLTNSVPIGFIYVQYSGQASPVTLWPSFGWTERTGTYAGQFFRAEGGNSAAFGTTQAYNSPRITMVEYEDHENHPTSTSLPVGGRSASVRSGNWNGNGDKVGLVFTTSSGEVRPYNSAIKIWQRTG